MRLLFFPMLVNLAFALVWSQPGRAARIEAMSNVHEGRVIFSLTGENQHEASTLIQVGSPHMARTGIPLPDGLDEEETLGLLLFSDRLLLISQKTVGGGRPPHLRQYLTAEKKWTLVGEIPCRSFQNVNADRTSLSVDCEEDPLKSDSTGKKSLRLSPPLQSGLKLVLPILNQTGADISVALTGPKGAWTGVDITPKGERKIHLSSDELAKIKN